MKIKEIDGNKETYRLSFIRADGSVCDWYEVVRLKRLFVPKLYNKIVSCWNFYKNSDDSDPIYRHYFREVDGRIIDDGSTFILGV